MKCLRDKECEAQPVLGTRVTPSLRYEQEGERKQVAKILKWDEKKKLNKVQRVVLATRSGGRGARVS